MDNAKTKLVDLAEPLGFDNHFLGRISVRWMSPWLAELRRKDHTRFVEEYVEQIVATSLHWRDKCRVTSRYNAMFLNEPTSGNGELAGEQSTEKARWQALKPLAVKGRAEFEVALPAFSVTSLGAAGLMSP